MAVAIKPDEITHEQRGGETVEFTVNLGGHSASFTLGGIRVDSLKVYDSDSRIEFIPSGQEKRVWLNVTVPIRLSV